MTQLATRDKEEDMSDLKKCDVAAIKYIQKLGSRDMELIIPHNQEIVNIDGRYILRDKKPQYPKTYEECCEFLGIGSYFEPEIRNATTEECHKFMKFMKLKRCRDAYWKVAGEQMGLGKPWEPDWRSVRPHKFGIYTFENQIRYITLYVLNNLILVFPTEEMRDEFYNNFKDLIESCKELL